MSRQLRSSNKIAQQQNFSLKCLKSIQKCIKDLKKAMRQMQFESQRIQKHQIQQILNNCNNLLTALTSCNLYRIHFQEEMYYLTQLKKIEKGINDIVEFVSELCKRKYFNNLGNNKMCEDLFNQLESTFDQFVGPLLHIFNSFNVSWLLFQCDPKQLFLLDEFCEQALIQKLGLDLNDIKSSQQKQEENSLSKDITSSQENSHINKEGGTPKKLTGNRPELSRQLSGSMSDNQKSGKKINYNINIVKFKERLSEEEINFTKQQLKDLLREYKKLIPEEECLSELAILIDFNSCHNPQNYQLAFNNYYQLLFDQITCEKISYILSKIQSFDKLNLFCRLIFYNADIMTLTGHQIVKHLNQYSYKNLKDLKIKLIRSGFNTLPVPITHSPLQRREKNQLFHFNQGSISSLQSLQKQSDEKLENLQPNSLSSGQFKIDKVFTLCPHQSNFFSLIPRIEKKTELKSQEVCCQYVKQKLEAQALQEKITMENSYLKRSNSINIKKNSNLAAQFADDLQSLQKTMIENQMGLLLESTVQTQNIEQIQDEDENENDNPLLFNKRELIFGRKAKNAIFKPDFCFEENEFQISRQQFKIIYEDQSNQYYVQCISQSALTQILVDDAGFELQVGTVFIVQDLIAFEVVALKSFSQTTNQSVQQTNNNQKIFTNKVASQQNSSPRTPDSSSKVQFFNNHKSKTQRLSYKNSQLFEDNESQYALNDQIKNQDIDKKNLTSEQSNSDQSFDNEIKDDLLNSLENENSSINSSLASISSMSQIVGNQMYFNQEKRSSINQKKHSFISQIRRQNSRKSSIVSQTINAVSENNYAESTQINCQSNVTQDNQTRQQKDIDNYRESIQIENDIVFQKQDSLQQNLSSNSEQIKQSKENRDELTLDFKKQAQNSSEKQSIQNSVQQSTLMNGMNISTSRVMLQSTFNQMNQSIYSLVGPSFQEFEEDNQNSNEALLQLRVLWSNIETEKEDYIFQYNNINEQDKILIKIGSDKDNQIRVQDQNHTIRNTSHCLITYQDKAWTLQATHNDQNFYSGIAVKKIDEIESGLISKKILIEKGFNILVKGYIFQCDF
ncbi:hypothetical protein ABPG72_016495 [Tetrahymena utriculariae]